MPLTQVLSDARSREKPCIRCGYSLRGNPDARHCPECGLSVWLSLNQNEDLDWSSPAWTASLSLASWIMAAAQVLGMLAWVLMVLPPGVVGNRLAGAKVLAGVYFIVYHTAMLTLLCRHENRHPDRLKSQRSATQIVSIIAMGVGVLLLCHALPLLEFGATTPPTGRPIRPGGAGPGMPRMDLWIFLAELTFAAGILCTWTFFRRLGRRIPSATATRICGWMLLMPLIPVGKALPFVTLYLAYQLSWLFALAPVVYFPVTAILLGWFALAFKRCSRHGTDNWILETMK
ncbi:MAG: hypothetical protein ABSH20_14615 [Tepidisphaeraceae bacterium]|jgi:hypothetical protein